MNSLEHVFKVITSRRLPEVTPHVKQLIADNVLTDDIIQELIPVNDTDNQILQKLYIADYQYSKEMQHVLVNTNQLYISWISNPDPDILKQCLTSEELIIKYSYIYKLVVTEQFANNQILIKKWLRYAETIRNLQ